MNTRKQFALFLKRLDNLPPWKLTAVTTAVSERAWPNFVLFSELADFGNAEDARHCLNMLWDHVAGYQSSKNFERLLEKLEPNIPNLEEVDMFGAVPAHDVIVSIICAVNCSMEPDAGETASALTLSLSTIGKFVKYAEVPDLKGTELQQYIEEHDLYLQQLDFIDEVFETLKKAKQTPELMKSLRSLAKNESISHLGISLEG